MYPKILAGYAEEKVIWFIPYDLNAVFVYDTETESVSFIFSFVEVMCRKNTYRTMIKTGNKLILAPFNDNEFVVYDFEKKEYYTYRIDEPFKAAYAVNYKGAVYFTGQEPMVAKYCMHTGELKLYREFQKEKFCQYDAGKNIWSRGAGCVDGCDIWIPNIHNATILKWNMEEDTYSYFDIEGLNAGISNIICMERNIWVLPREGSDIYCVERESGKSTTVDIGKEITGNYHMRQWREALLLLDYMTGEILKINSADNTLKRIDKVSKITKRHSRAKMQVRWGDIVEDNLYLSLVQEDGMAQLDLHTEGIEMLPMPLEERESFDETIFGQGIAVEGVPYCGLSDLIHYSESGKREHAGSEIGSMIYQTIIEDN